MSPMTRLPILRLAELIILPLVWAVLVFIALETKRLVSGGDYSVCGPWGCGPETGALVAMHSVWLAIVGPPMLYCFSRMNLSFISIHRIALGLFSSGVVGMLAIIAWQWLIWLPRAGVWSKDYVWQRCGFVIVTSVDVPLIPAVILGIVLWNVNTVREWKRRASSRSIENPSNDKDAVSVG